MPLRIKELAKGKGLSMNALSDRIGIDRVTLYRNINGNPTLETLQKIADALEVPIRELFSDDKGKELLVRNEDGSLTKIGVLNQ